MKKLTCSICNYSADNFNDYLGQYYILGKLKDHYTKNAICPACNSDIRHRFVYKFINEMTTFKNNKLKLLHFAPEKWLAEKVLEMQNISYFPVDIEPEKFLDFKVEYADVTDLYFEDNSFDAMISVHVLEHIVDDLKALQEMFRVLKPGGWCVIAVPTIGESTHEDLSLDAQMREKMYGISDHFRLYGTDLIEKLKLVGFQAKLFELKDLGDDFVDLSVTSKHIDSDKYLFYCTKPQLTPEELKLKDTERNNLNIKNLRISPSYKTPLISIITVTYNAANELIKTLESISNQTFCDYELIIVDGKSTDNTIEIIKQYQSNISYWVSEIDNGIYDAMNKALIISKGKYVQFLNAGDFFSNKDVLRRISRRMDNDTTLVYGDIYIDDVNGKRIYQKASEFTIDNLLKRGTGIICHQAMFVKRERAVIYNTKYKYKAELNWYFDLAELDNFSYQHLSFPVVCYALGGFGHKHFIKNRLNWLRVIYDRYGIISIFKSKLILFLLKNSLSRYPVLNRFVTMAKNPKLILKK